MPKFNMSPKKNPMPSQAPDVRNKNFEEVALGYSEETAIDEAKRCLGCKNTSLCERLPRQHSYPRIHRQGCRGRL